jgi:NAD-dependent DNA ligase
MSKPSDPYNASEINKVEEIGSDLLNISGLGQKSLSSLLQFASNKRNLEIVEGLLVEIQMSLPPVEPLSSAKDFDNNADKAQEEKGNELPFAGRCIVFTGKLTKPGAGFLSRADAFSLCRELGFFVFLNFSPVCFIFFISGGTCEDSITKKVNLLIDCNLQLEDAPGFKRLKSSKIIKAEALGIEIWDLITFWSFVEKTKPL